MRFFVRAVIPTVSGNKAIVEGRLSAIIEGLTNELKPEIAFFRANESGPTAGMKSINLIVNGDSAAQLRTKMRPLFEPIQAEVEYEQVMLSDELLEALPTMQESVKKYGDDGRTG